MSNAGRHLILDLYGCSPEVLDDYDQLFGLLNQALVLSRATVLQMPQFIRGHVKDMLPLISIRAVPIQIQKELRRY
jgi:hypothetical protein